jgi:hypothetical protein
LSDLFGWLRNRFFHLNGGFLRLSDVGSRSVIDGLLSKALLSLLSPLLVLIDTHGMAIATNKIGSLLGAIFRFDLRATIRAGV